MTIRGLRRLSVCVERSIALSVSTRRKQRLRSLGLCGGKSPGEGLFAAHKLYVAGEGQLLVRHAMPRRSLVQQPAHRIVRQYPALELLPHQLGRFAAQHTATLEHFVLKIHNLIIML